MWAVIGGEVVAALCATSAGEGRTGPRCHEGPVCSIPEAWIPAYPDLSAPAGLRVGLAQDPSPVASGGPAGDEEAAPGARGGESAADTAPGG